MRKLTSRTLPSFSAISLVLLLASINSTRATTIVVARTSTEIVIGADSKVTDSYGKALNSETCKIQQVGNLFIAFEGLLRDKKTGFVVADIARRALQLKFDGTAAERVSILTGFLTTALVNELIQVKRNSPDEFQKKLEGRTFLRVVVAGFEKNKPVVFVRNFRMALVAGKMAVTVIPDDCLDDCQGDVVTRFLGETAAIDGLPEETPGFWTEGVVAGVRRLLEVEIMARSEYVGPPIDILRIDAKGAKWVQKKAQCPAIQPLPRRSTSPRKRAR
ncbi:MAG: hypothetical protein M3539_18650 [Acidobacteriota bacterium]|nr:hypothetical protein [Acidobacteriota bacterium]